MISCVSFCSIQVNNDLMLSPGRVTIKDTKSIDRKRNIEKQRKSSISYKRRRIELKKNMLDTTAANETREGPTYVSLIGCRDEDIATDDLVQIPGPYPVPVKESLTSDNTGYNFVYFDLETTGLGKV